MSLYCYLRFPLVLTAVMALQIACSHSDAQSDTANEVGTTMDSLVSVDWLRQHINDPDLVVLDCTVLFEEEDDGYRLVSGRANYDVGHIPTAGFADLTGELSDGDSPIEFAVPKPEQFVAAMSALGVGDHSRVVLYDANGSAWAARVWWMLRWIGFDNAALLNGGAESWIASGHQLTADSTVRAEGELTLALRPELIADRDEVLASLDNSNVKFIDALPEAQYRGDMSMYARPGHIPGASNIPSSSLVDDSGQYLPEAKLAEIFGNDRSSRAIHYCGGGIAASSTAFAMTRLGFTDVAVYTASLQEWAADPANPLEISAVSEGKGE